MSVFLALRNTTPHPPGLRNREATGTDKVDGRIMDPPQDVHTLISGTWKYAASHGKRDFADVIKLMTLNGESLQDYPGGPNVNTWVPKIGGPFLVEFRVRGR